MNQFERMSKRKQEILSIIRRCGCIRAIDFSNRSNMGTYGDTLRLLEMEGILKKERKGISVYYSLRKAR